MRRAIAIACLVVGVLFVTNTAWADWTTTEGLYGECFKTVDDSYVDADTSTVYCKKLPSGPTVYDITGDEPQELPLNVARFADATPPGTYIANTNSYKMWARKVYGTVIWASPWTDSLYYYNGAHIERELYLVNTGQTE